MSTRPLIKTACKLLHVIGLDPTNQTIWTRLRSVTIVSLMSYLFFEEMASFVLRSQGWDSLDAVTSGGALYQMTFKFLFLMVKRQTFVSFMKNFDEFWSFEDLNKDVQKEIGDYHKFVRKCMVVYASTFASTAVAYSVRPLFTSGTKVLPIATYHPETYDVWHEYLLMYFLEVFDTSIGVFMTFSADYMFVAFIAEIICEFKIMKNSFATMDVENEGEEKCLRKIDDLIEHHCLLLRLVKELDDIYSLLLLNQLSNSLILLCLGMVGIIISGFPPDLQHLSNYGSFMAVIFSQLLIFCMIGEVLTAECESLSEAVYASDWYVQTQPALRRRCVLIILRANRKEMLTAGGMFTLNLESFTSVVNTAMSFYTVAQALY